LHTRALDRSDALTAIFGVEKGLPDLEPGVREFCASLFDQMQVIKTANFGTRRGCRIWSLA